MTASTATGRGGGTPRRPSGGDVEVVQQQESLNTGARRRILVLIVLMMGFSAIASIVVVALVRVCPACPSGERITAFRPEYRGVILDRRGRVLGHNIDRQFTKATYEAIPKRLRDAIIAVEDRRFEEHAGIDFRSCLRAAVAVIKSVSLKQGCSTISMQFARLAFLPERLRGPEWWRKIQRKIWEFGAAREIEQVLTKDWILQHYLNMAPFHGRTEGVEAASQVLFTKSVNQVNLEEAALLVAILKGPTFYDPQRHPVRAKTRRNVVLAVMRREGIIDAATEARSREASIRLKYNPGWRPPSGDEGWAISYARGELQRLAPELAGRSDIVVATTLDSTANTNAVRAVQRGVAILRSYHKGARGASQFEGALVAVDPASGAIRALVGGVSYPAGGGFNRATRAHRQPGSAFKPFLWAAALEHGLHAQTILIDEPITIRKDGTEWRPRNFDGRFRGAVTFAEAAALSLNVPHVKVAHWIGVEAVQRVAVRCGVTSRLGNDLAIALGQYEVTPLELAHAYGCLRTGLATSPFIVSQIRTMAGEVLWEKSVHASPHVVADPVREALAEFFNGVLLRGTARQISRLSSYDVFPKTGTTNGPRDLWFVATTPEIASVTWFGRDDARPMNGSLTGGSIPAQVWAQFYERSRSALREASIPAVRDSAVIAVARR